MGIYALCCLLFIPFIVNYAHGVDFNECKSTTCGSNGPLVRFPFRIKGKQPDHCGYPQHWFDLSCSAKNDTVLELTPSWKISIQKIDYKSQVIYANDSQGCLPRRLLSFNLSFSPFQFKYKTFYTLFNCSSVADYGYRYQQVSCLSNIRYKVYAVYSEVPIDHYVHLLSCTKIHDIISADLYGYEQNIFQWSWSNPTCGSCEAKGKYCGLESNNTGSKTKCYGSLKTGSSTKLITTGATLGSFLLVGAVIALYRIYSFNKTEREYQSKIENFLEDYKSFKPTRFSYAQIKRMTNQFKYELGQGAYGTVFRGKLSGEIPVAVKLLNNSKGNGEEFVNEVGTIGRIHHANVVRLIGFCADGFRRALVYEYLPNDSLQKFISSPDTKRHSLGWKKLQHITHGIAKGVEYLHQGCDQRILHFDIKPQNILLDHEFNPKVSDFGLAKLCAKDQSAVSMTTAKGTAGYMAPEVFSRNFGSVSYKSDVYSFGMLVLEMVGGRKIVDETEEQIYFPEWIYNLLEGGEDLRLEIEEEGEAEIAKKLAIAGLWCIQWHPMDRPSMKTIVQILEDERDNLPIPPNPFRSAVSNAKMPGRRLHLELDVISETE